MTIVQLQQKCLDIRKDIIQMIHLSQSGHTGSSLSCVEILVTLYYQTMRLRPDQPNWEERARFVLSKAHANPTLYAILADLSFSRAKS